MWILPPFILKLLATLKQNFKFFQIYIPANEASYAPG